MSTIAHLAAQLSGGDAERMVPRTGITANLTMFAAGAMAFLCVFALALLFSTSRVAERWASELANTATVRISAPAGQEEAQVAAVLAVLEQTPGISSARAMSDDEQALLLAPWLGPDLPLADLPVPRLVEITEASGGFDAEGLRLRLRAEAPGAVLDDHTRWRAPLIEAADRLRSLGWLAIILIAASMAAMVTLAATAALAANGQVIEVLRLAGARDAFVVRAFTRRFTLRAFLGAMVGAVFAMAAVAVMPNPGTAASFFSGLGFRGGEWFAPLFVPFAAAIVAFLSTRLAATRRLRSIR